MSDPTPTHCDDEIRYDAFLAHSSKDAAIVERVLQQLEERGIKCCYSKRDFLPGYNLITVMQESIRKSNWTIAFISKDFLESPHCKVEREMALQKAMEVERHAFIPLLLDVPVQNIPLAIRRLTCLHVSMNSDDYLTKLLEAMGVKEPSSIPTYHFLKRKVQELEKEKSTMIRNSLQFRCQVSSQLGKKDDMIRQLQRENAVLQESKIVEGKKIALELDECKRQMSVMQEESEKKDEIITRLKQENKNLAELKMTTSGTALQEPTIRDIYKKLNDMVDDEMYDMKAEEVVSFFTKVLLLLQIMMNCFPADNTVIKKMYASVSYWIGWKTGEDEDWNSQLNYYTQALVTVHKLYGVNTAHSDTAAILNNIGVCHHFLQSYHAAAEYHSQSLQMYKQLAGPSGMSKALAVSYYNLGGSQVHIGNCTQQAICNLTQALVMHKKCDGDQERIEMCLICLEYAYDQSGDSAQAAACRRQRDAIEMQS